MVRDDKGVAVMDQFDDLAPEDQKQAKTAFGKQEIRTYEQFSEPFPLYPGEEIQGKIMPYQTVPQSSALVIQVLQPFKSEDGTQRIVGDKYLFKGPNTYIPKVEEKVINEIKATTIKANEALHLKALRPLTDSEGVQRRPGESWLYTKKGNYLPQADEEISKVVKAYILKEDNAIKLRAKKDFKDAYGVQRRAGEEWLITKAITDTHFLGTKEEYKET